MVGQESSTQLSGEPATTYTVDSLGPATPTESPLGRLKVLASEHPDLTAAVGAETEENEALNLRRACAES